MASVNHAGELSLLALSFKRQQIANFVMLSLKLLFLSSLSNCHVFVPSFLS